jgi:hypothetical protein
MKTNVLDAGNSMLLGCPWVRDVKVTHNWGNNLISIEGNGIVRTIVITKHLDNNTKCLKVLLCYDFVNRVTNEEENLLLAAKLDLFTIITITLPKLEVLAIMSIDGKTGTNPKIDTNAKIGINVEIDIDPKIDIDTKPNIEMKINTVEPIFYFPHTPREILVDITLTWIKVQDMKMAKWNLS